MRVLECALLSRFSKIGFSRTHCGKIKRFIESVENLPEFIPEFDAGPWAGLAGSKDRIVFRLTCGMEIES